jgi:hypothetical protein
MLSKNACIVDFISRVCQIVERDGFKVDKDFVGHRKAVTCVRFSNNIYERSVQGKPAMYLYMAIGESYSALLYGIYLFFLYIFWRARVCWPLLCLCRPFYIFEKCLDS